MNSKLKDGLKAAERYFLEMARGSQEGEDYALAEFCYRAIDHIEAIEKQIEALKAKLEWQPIDTAPKDGTEILVCRPDAGVLLARYGCLGDWLNEQESEIYDDETLWSEGCFMADFIAGGRLDDDDPPTHWMPLPEPPKESSNESD